jgi:hypothetical protein
MDPTFVLTIRPLVHVVDPPKDIWIQPLPIRFEQIGTTWIHSFILPSVSLRVSSIAWISPEWMLMLLCENSVSLVIIVGGVGDAFEEQSSA